MIEVEMSTKEIESLLESKGKKVLHKNILQKVNTKLLPLIGGLNFQPTSIFTVKESTYLDKSKRDSTMYILNKWAVNALMANYSLEHAMVIMQHMYELEHILMQRPQWVFDAVTGSNYLSQHIGLKCAKIKHPNLLMKHFRTDSALLYEAGSQHKTGVEWLIGQGYLCYKTINQHKDKAYRWTTVGLEWLQDHSTELNERVEVIKKNKT